MNFEPQFLCLSCADLSKDNTVPKELQKAPNHKNCRKKKNAGHLCECRVCWGKK